jgi:hypothetical protein
MVHQQALLKIVGFLKKHPYLPLWYPKNAPCKPKDMRLAIHSTSDSSLGNSHVRRSHFGYNIYINDMLTMHKCKFSSLVAKSAPEAEYISMLECDRGMKHVHNILHSMGLMHDCPMTLRNDCAPAITIVEKEQLTPRNMHIDIAYHSVRDSYIKGLINPIKIGTEVSEADIYTKPLCRMKFWRCAAGGCNYEIDEYGHFEGDQSSHG